MTTTAIANWFPAPTTDAGTYKILKAPTPAGTNASEATHTHTGPSHTHTVSGLS